MPDTKTSRHHDHNQRHQSRSYTAEQKAAVDRVRRCKGTDYYAILDVKKEVTADGIKKAYRRLAMVMHPDKNSAPGADEAFKLVSKAFQVLSDPQQRETFDRFGGDPAARGGEDEGEENSFSRFRSTGGAGAGGFAGGPELSPEDLFNMFFGGGFPGPGAFGGGSAGGGGLFGGEFDGGGLFGEFMSFGGPEVRVQHFGGPEVREQHFGGLGVREQHFGGLGVREQHFGGLGVRVQHFGGLGVRVQHFGGVGVRVQHFGGSRMRR